MPHVRSARLPRDVLGGLELERGVIDVVVIGEARREEIEHITRLRVRLEDHVCRHDVHPARDGPRVEVVNVADAGRVEDVATDMSVAGTTA